MYKKSKRPQNKRVLVVVMAVVLCVTLAVSAFAGDILTNTINLGVSGNDFASLGLSGEIGADEVIPGVTWKDLQRVLSLSNKYRPEHVEWLQDNKEKLTDHLPRAVEKLMKNQKGAEADLFIDYVEGLMNRYEGAEPLENLAAPNGLASSTDKVSAEVTKRVESRSETVSDEMGSSLTSFEKTVTPNEKFRHYDIALTIEPKESGASQFGAASDIVLLINASDSMSGEKLSSAKSVARDFVKEALQSTAQNKIGIVVYNGEAVTESHLVGSSEKSKLLSIINSIEASGDSNPQAGILKSREVLGLLDSDRASGERRQVIVHLTDGSANLTHTDNVSYVHPIGGGDRAQRDMKRWSYIDGEGKRAISTSSLSPSNSGSAKRIAMLESQYTAYQGVEMFVMDYSPNGDGYLDNSTLPLDNPPSSFTYGEGEDADRIKTYNPVSDLRTKGGTSAVYSATSYSEIMEAFEASIDYKNESKTPIFDIIDEFDPAVFELAGQPEIEEKYQNTDSVLLTDKRVNWSSKNENLTETRTIRYTLRVIDSEVLPKGSVEEEIGEDSWVSYVSGNNKIRYHLEEQPKVAVEALLDITAEATNTSGSKLGEYAEARNILLNGEITGGTGSFEYTWSQAGSQIIAPTTVKAMMAGDSLILGEDLEVKELANGNHKFILKVTDKRAIEAGYSGDGVATKEISVPVAVFFGEVTVNVDSAVGTLESKVTVESGETRTQYFMTGSDNMNFELPVGSRVSVETYAPVGYNKVATKSVTVNPGKDLGNAQPQSVSVQLTQKRTPLFHTLVWGK